VKESQFVKQDKEVTSAPHQLVSDTKDPVFGAKSSNFKLRSENANMDQSILLKEKHDSVLSDFV